MRVEGSFANRADALSPLPFTGEEGPAAKRWEVRVLATASEKRKKTLTLPSPAGGRGETAGRAYRRYRLIYLRATIS
jgi:hypothetical protein